ncbi:GNAT family N-acetyltransferase [Albimonas sp. CAU 1670]|uniref:GNAT family N-acetyltransferase n=1 Tax=Albimonas sp. CAU 1670 TaxID=3032599 RepID=UPI0023DA4C77|nr:GNAT family N-acetyltransferase [Albimonas sp. CAU 1670]MDF2235832.1 GNAT family N-acetyltransferase [Albimonas sp. CAU 1670]
MEIRALSEGDLGAVAEIWNPIIRDTAITFNPVEKTLDDLRAWLSAPGPALGAFEGERLLGFASAHQFRGGLGYRRTFEHSINLGPEGRGRGLGRPLMEALFDALRPTEVHSLIGAITATNAVSIAFHARLGFVEVGRIPQAGWKFDLWHDLVLMQKIL